MDDTKCVFESHENSKNKLAIVAPFMDDTCMDTDVWIYIYIYISFFLLEDTHTQVVQVC